MDILHMHSHYGLAGKAKNIIKVKPWIVSEPLNWRIATQPLKMNMGRLQETALFSLWAA